MEYILTPYNAEVTPWATWDNVFSNDELSYLQKIAADRPRQAMVGSADDGTVDPNVRRSDLNWLSYSKETKWVFDRLAHVVSSINAKFFRFDITGFGESIQLTNYSSTDNGMYNWHVDFGPNGVSRKLSLVLQLSDPSEYEGGNLELNPHGNNIAIIPKRRGLIAVFPAWTLHQVTPVTSGLRQSLVSWITGPSFK